MLSLNNSLPFSNNNILTVSGFLNEFLNNILFNAELNTLKCQVKKEDGTNAKVDDSLEFKVLEFNKESKKIILALPKVEEEKEVKSAEEKAADKAAKQAKRTVKQINDNIEHSTLGDLEVLAGLKENLEKQEKAQQGE